MQIIHACSFSPEEYASSELHRQVRAPQCCPWCGKAGVLEALGYYRRYVSASAGKVLQIGVRRFLCRWCRITVSLLPGFAHPYRLVQSKGIEQFFNGEREGPLVAAWRDLLLTYWKRFCGFCEQLPGGLRATLGAVLARGPPGPEPEKLWRRLLPVPPVSRRHHPLVGGPLRNHPFGAIPLSPQKQSSQHSRASLNGAKGCISDRAGVPHRPS